MTWLHRCLFGLVVATAAAASASAARADVVDRVVAVVNDEAIFLSELRRRATPFYPRLMQVPEMQRETALREIYSRLLSELIDEELISQAAREAEIRVRGADVRRAIDRVRAQSGLGEAEFWQAVEAQGYTEAQYRADLRRQLLRLRVINQRVRTRVNLTEEDVRRVYDDRLREANRDLRFRTSQIFFEVPAGTTATEEAAIRREAEAVRRDVRSPERFEAMMDTLGGMELGWLSQGDLPDALEAALLGLDAGEISAPVRGDRGYHIFLLHERETGARALPSFEQARDRLMETMMAEAMQRQESLYLGELRRGAVVENRLDTALENSESESGATPDAYR